MEPRTQFTGRYKKDLSTENLRTKVAHRKSVMQKENRHNEFKKCRGLSLTDANISALKECELPPLEETNESSILKAEETTDVGKSKEYLKQRRDLLQRFKEEKELRKLKEQREKAAKCVFKCGIYKPDVTFPPVWSSQHTSKIKPKEKQAPPGVPRVTRSISKAEPAGNKANRTQHVKTGVLNTSKISAERGITKVCGQNSALKKPETKVAPSQRGVRTAVTTTTTATTKPALRNNVVTKSQNKTTKETKTIENSKKSLVCEQPRLKEAKRLPKEKTVEVTSSKESREAPHEKKPSFAPQNFMFQVMDGLSPYKFKPMTPRRANAFLSPCFVRSPMKGERNHLPAPPKCNKTQTAGEQVLPVEQVPEPERSELGMDDNPVAQQKVEQVQVPEPESSELEMDNRLVAQQKVEQVLPVEQVQVPEPERSELGMDDNPVAQQKVEQVLVPMPEHSELEIDDHPVAQQKVEQELPVEQVLVPEPECSELEMDDHPVAQQKVEQVQVPEPESSELEMDNRLVAQQKVEQVLPVEQVQVPEPEHSELGMDDNPVAQQKVEQVQVPMPEHSELEIDDHPKETEQEALKEPEHDVPYFRDILKSESEKLRCLCCEWDKRIELDIPEDAKDVIRTTVGQTRLLMTERFKQFEGLVDNCEFKRGEKETTLTDLEGFWDMIYYQIEDVNKKFFNLGKLEENSWQQGTAPTRKIIKKKIVPAAASKSSQGDNGRAAARSRLAAIKAALKNKGKQEEPTVEAPARPTRVDEVVFDAGFFRVASPAKVANRARCSSSWLSPTPQPITSRIQQSDNPTGEQITEVPNSPATVKSLISKSLFENTEGSVQSDEQHPLPSVVETDEAACVFPVADLAKYLVPMENSGFQLCDSPAPEEVGTVPSRALFLEEIAGISGSFVNDVFMCSPQTNSPPAQPMSPTKESDGVCGTQDLNVQNDQLDFLGSCPPINMINRASFKCGAVAMADNSIVFSPIKKQKNLQRILKHNPELLDS
ncbi:hypothetical protein XELAEV_18039848mg [Xenopus laevis]|uniref:Disks large-associated protein 5 n=1 Tax=Xenopus laevis TaxID=8355 RepID=A0A974C916_XENLA|nr:hypothetical protein XELAEV_18039848mg [Xenopus laevis]